GLRCIAEELWREPLGMEGSVHTSRWPTFDPKLVQEERVTLVVQIDGKVRDRIEVEPDVTSEQIEQVALASPRVQRALDGRTIERVIAKPPRLVNLVSASA